MSHKQYLYDYPENRELAKDLIRGEKKIIWQMLNKSKNKYSYKYIIQVLQGKRKNKKITDFTKEYIKNRNDLLKSFK